MNRSSVHPLLVSVASAADDAYRTAMATMTRAERSRDIGTGGDGTATMFLDEYVERPVLAILERAGVNVLSEEAGWIDRGSAMTVVIDPVDGTANSAAGVPISAFAAALAVDGEITEAYASWLGTGHEWRAHIDDPVVPRTTGRESLEGSAMSMLRPRPETWRRWSAVARRAERVRVLGSSVIEACLVADGAVDGFCDPGGDVHRIVDIAAAALIVEKSGGAVRDLHGRAFTLEPDLSLRWSGVFAATARLAEEIVSTITEEGA